MPNINVFIMNPPQGGKPDAQKKKSQPKNEISKALQVQKQMAEAMDQIKSSMPITMHAGGA